MLTCDFSQSHKSVKLFRYIQSLEIVVGRREAYLQHVHLADAHIVAGSMDLT